jgi:repressor LexA
MNATAVERLPLTKRQREVLEFIVSVRAAKGYSPTVREICRHFKFDSVNGAMCHLHPLRLKGWITWEDFRSRTIIPTGGDA